MKLVTCLCLTKNRRDWLSQAIASFRLQTYANRELLIVSEGESVRDLIPSDSSICVIERGTPFSTIGEKRNFGCAHASGELIAHWDDDDVSAPGRLADQVGRIEESGKAVTGYHSMRFTDGRRWWKYVSGPLFALGTSLLYRRQWWETHPFPAKQVGEDNAFVDAAVKAAQLIAVDADAWMHATIHAGNTSPRKMIGSNWKELSA